MELEYECNLISYSGSARSKAIFAIRQARQGNFEEARALLEEADAQLMQAHDIEKEIITREARGEVFSSGVLMIHAQDHLNSATLTISSAEELIPLYERLTNLEKKVME